MKLSKAQREVLTDIKRWGPDGASLSYRTMDALERKGFIELVDGKEDPTLWGYRITPAGRKALEGQG